MCGLIAHFNCSPTENVSEASLLAHRGPDHRGQWNTDKTYFDFYRLAIIDLDESANQPFSDNGRHCLVFNGEIYNFKELRRDCLSDCEFKTSSDTEVLYRGLIKFGKDFLPKLEGMFAFVFYDKEKDQVLVAGDRFGIKPLYYYHDSKSGRIVISSEQKAIYNTLKSPEINFSCLHEYFTFKFVSGRNTLISGVNQLLPGECIEVEPAKNSLVRSRWYRLPSRKEKRSEKLIEELESAIESSVKLQLISDVPLGLQLSGGIDSALIAHFARKLKSTKFHSFSIAFPGSPFDESSEARQTAEFNGIIHHDIPFTERDFVEEWEACTYYNDEPINHPHSIPIYHLTKYAREFVTVLLSGEGADEVFLGYERYNKFLNANSSQTWLDYTIFSEGSLRKEFLNPEIYDQDFYGQRQALLESKEVSSHFSNYDMQTHLITLLNRIDKMSMGNSLEIRVPFLDSKVAELGFTQPVGVLIDENSRKKPIMELYERIYKSGKSQNSKIGFHVPFDQWLQSSGETRDFVVSEIEKLLDDGVFQKKALEMFLAELKNQSKLESRHFRMSWLLTNYSLWKRIVLEKTSPYADKIYG